MKKLQTVLTALIFIISSGFIQPNKISDHNLSNIKKQVFATSHLGVTTPPNGVTITRISYDDPSNSAVSWVYPTPNSFNYQPIADQNFITVRIAGGFNNVYIRTTGGTIIDQLSCISSGTNNYDFSVNLSPSATYEVFID
jgi:hypothetical protein